MDTLNPNWPKNRQTPRRSLEVPLSATVGSETFRGWTTDVGAGGLGLTVAAAITASSEMLAEFSIDAGAPIKVQGVIRYRKGFKYGLEFLMITPKDLEAIKKYVLAGVTAQQ
jgi:hypothetical protein